MRSAGRLNEARLPGRRRRSWEANVKLNLQETGCNGLEWIHWRGFVNTVMKRRIA